MSHVYKKQNKAETYLVHVGELLVISILFLVPLFYIFVIRADR